MAENKTKPTAQSVDDHIAAIDPKLQADARELRALCESVAGEPAKMWGPSIIGAGQYHYKYESGREGDMPEVGFAARSGKFALYIMGEIADRQDFLDRLGKHSSGKGCLYVKRLDDIDRTVLRQLMMKCIAALRAKYGGEK
ncbi:MAG: DUF1801 domain-containing protein [Hyphomicrobiaceae bacterium]|nr:DUF1801 domain-containing protein [Hyphomicrobiaceae bacterium]